MQMEGCAKAFSVNTLFVGSGSCWTEWEKKKEDFHKIIGQYGVVPVAHRRNGRRILPLQRKNDVASQEKKHEGGFENLWWRSGKVVIRDTMPWHIPMADKPSRTLRRMASCPIRMEAARVIYPFWEPKGTMPLRDDGRTDDEQMMSKWQANDGRNSIIIRKSWIRKRKGKWNQRKVVCLSITRGSVALANKQNKV